MEYERLDFIAITVTALARTHPETGRKALYFSRGHTIRLRDMTEDESRPLIEYLQTHPERPEFTCRVRVELVSTGVSMFDASA
jgi:alpha-ketoglutarate-dependent taurine dioxygenase